MTEPSPIATVTACIFAARSAEDPEVAAFFLAAAGVVLRGLREQVERLELNLRVTEKEAARK